MAHESVLAPTRKVKVGGTTIEMSPSVFSKFISASSAESKGFEGSYLTSSGLQKIVVAPRRGRGGSSSSQSQASPQADIVKSSIAEMQSPYVQRTQMSQKREPATTRRYVQLERGAPYVRAESRVQAPAPYARGYTTSAEELAKSRIRDVRSMSYEELQYMEMDRLLYGGSPETKKALSEKGRAESILEGFVTPLSKSREKYPPKNPVEYVADMALGGAIGAAETGAQTIDFLAAPIVQPKKAEAATRTLGAAILNPQAGMTAVSMASAGMIKQAIKDPGYFIGATAVATLGAKGAAKAIRGFPIKAATAKLPGTPRYTGIVLRTGEGAAGTKPLLGLAGRRPTAGTPKINLETLDVGSGYVPKTGLESRIFMQAIGTSGKVTATGEEFIKSAIRGQELTVGQRSKFISELPKTTGTLSEKGVKEVIKASRKIDATVYGSYATTAQLRKGALGRIPGDIDIQTTLSQARSMDFAKSLAAKLEKAEGRGNIRISEKSPTLIERQVRPGKFAHAVDIHSAEMLESDLASASMIDQAAYGFNLGRKPVPLRLGRTQVKAQTLSEQGIRKAASSATVRGISKKFPGGVSPELHRMKDVSDLITVQEGLIESMKRGKLSFLRKGRIAEAEGQLAITRRSALELFGIGKERLPAKVEIFSSSMYRKAASPSIALEAVIGSSVYGGYRGSASRASAIYGSPSAYARGLDAYVYGYRSPSRLSRGMSMSVISPSAPSPSQSPYIFSPSKASPYVSPPTASPGSPYIGGSKGKPIETLLIGGRGRTGGRSPSKGIFDETGYTKGKGASKPGFDVYSKRRVTVGNKEKQKRFKINPFPVDLESARSMGAQYVDNNPAASFTVYSTGKKAQGSTLNLWTGGLEQKFRSRKRARTTALLREGGRKQKRMVPVFSAVEKSKYRLDSFGEQTQLASKNRMLREAGLIPSRKANRRTKRAKRGMNMLKVI